MRMRRPPRSRSTVEWPSHVAWTPPSTGGTPSACVCHPTHRMPCRGPPATGENGRHHACPDDHRPDTCRPAALGRRVGPPGAAPAAHRAPRRGVPGRARADGRHHEQCVPPAVPRVRHGGPRGRALGASGATSLYVSEMVTSRALVERTPETMRLISHDPEEQPRSVQLYSVDPVTAGLAARMLVERGPRRPHRPQLRLPRPQGHPQGRRGRAAVEDRPLPGDRRRRGAGGAAVCRAGHREDARRHRRRPRDLPGRRSHRRGGGCRGGGAARPHRSPGVLGPGRLVGDRAAQGGGDVVPVLGNGDIWSAEDALDGAADRVRRGRRRPRVPRATVALHRPRGGLRRLGRAGAVRACAR